MNYDYSPFLLSYFTFTCHVDSKQYILFEKTDKIYVRSSHYFWSSKNVYSEYKKHKNYFIPPTYFASTF